MSTVASLTPLVVVVVLAIVALIAVFSRSFRAFVAGMLVAAFSTWVASTTLTGALTPIAYVIGFIAFWITAAWAMKSL